MIDGQLANVLQHVRGLASDAGRWSDRELLERFVEERDEAAFAALFQRHGPLVLGVCRRLLRHTQDAEDACQAAFLVLARRARSVRNKESLGSWLYGVAFRVASNLRRQRGRHRAWEGAAADAAQPGGEEASWREVQTMLDEELHRLPEGLRAPLLLCCLEGKTRDEAAQQLGCTVGALRGRLGRGRDILRRRLARRGLDLSAVLLSVTIARGSSAAALPAPLLVSTVQAALLCRAGRPATLAAEALAGMGMRRGTLAAALLLAVVSLGVALLAPPPSRPASAGNTSTKNTPGTDLRGDPLPAGALARLGTARWRHGGPVFFVGLTHKGTRLVTASQDGWFRVWDPDSGKELRRFGRPYQGRPGADGVSGRSVFFDGVPAIVALSPDGRLLATGAQTGGARVWQDEGIHVWDVLSPDTGKQLWSAKQEGADAGLAFSADSKTLVTQGWRDFRQWEAVSGKPSTRIPRPADAEVSRVQGPAPLFTFSPNGKFLAGVVLDREGVSQPPAQRRTAEDRRREVAAKIISVVRLWDVKTGKIALEIKGRHGDFLCLAFSPDGKRLAVPSPDTRSIRVWDLAAGKEGRPLRGRPPLSYLFALAFSPDGKVLASKGADRVIRLWDVNARKELRPLEGPFDPTGAGQVVGGQPPGVAQGLVFSSDGKVLFSSSRKSLVRRWEVATGKELVPGGGHTEGIQAAVLSPDGRIVTTRAADGIRQWDRLSGKEIRRLRLPPGAALATFSPDGRSLAFIAGHAVRLWDLAMRREVRRWRLPGREFKTYHPSWLYQMYFSANGRVLAAKNYEGTIFLWATATGQEVQTFPPETGRSRVKAGLAVHESVFALSPDGKTLARVEIIGPSPLVSPGDRPPGKDIPQTSVLRLYNVASGRKLQQSPSPVAISAALFSPDGRTLATVNRDRTLSLWEVGTGRSRLTIQDGGSVLAFSPNGKGLAVGDGPTLRLRSVLSGKELRSLPGHVGDVSALQFAPDGKTLVSGSTDTTLLVWDVSH